MECVYFQYIKATSPTIQCTECNKKRTFDPEKAVNSLVIGHRYGEKVGKKNSFQSWYNKNSSNITLMFKHGPPKRSDIMGSLTSRSLLTSNAEQHESLEEFSPMYAKKSRPVDTTVQQQNESLTKCVETNASSSSSESGRTLEKSNEKGLWCAGTSVKKYYNSSPQTKCNNKELLRIKKQCNVSDHHRGVWIITRDGCNSIKMSGAWREVCKMLKCGRLPYCNAKYQRIKQEIWLYCDVIESLNVRQKLRINNKLHITTPISYSIHPHGNVLKI